MKEDEIHAKKLTYNAMYIQKCATEDSVISKKRDPENMTSEELRKVLEPLQRQKDKQIKKIMITRFVIVSGYLFRRGIEE